MKKSKTVCFTFKQKTKTLDGTKLADVYVEVSAKSVEMAVAIFVIEFAQKNLKNPYDFAFMYNQESFDKEAYEGGCLLKLSQKKLKL